jgi:hypothetical protein
MFTNRTQRLVQLIFVPAIVTALLLLHSRVALLPAVGNQVVPTTAPAPARVCEAPGCGAPGNGAATGAAASPLGFGRVLGACAAAGVSCTPVAAPASTTPIATR